MMEGILQNIDENQVTIDGKVYVLAPRVKSSYLKLGKIEYSMMGQFIGYIKSLEVRPMNYPGNNNKTILVEYFEQEDGQSLMDSLNEFSKQNDVKATQTHVYNGKHCAYVYYVATLMDL